MRNHDKSRNKVASKKLAPPNYLIICEGKETEPNYFNGLKQIKYEPEERVRICESLPNSKPDYFVIVFLIFCFHQPPLAVSIFLSL